MSPNDSSTVTKITSVPPKPNEERPRVFLAVLERARTSEVKSAGSALRRRRVRKRAQARPQAGARF
eukprot:12279608-Heterocapsa_arctica.AAC.1